MSFCVADLSRLVEIQSEMIELLDEAEYIVRHSGDESAYKRAKSYWIAHIVTSLTNDHDYLGKSTCNMQDTIVELSPVVEACEGCGCEPGDGRTPGCAHPDGCGWTSD
jgi:hypothetical protein